MPEMNEPRNTLRDVLEANIAASEAGTLGQVAEAAPIQSQEEDQSAAAQRERDEQGRFKAKQAEEAAAAQADAQTQAAEPQAVETPPQPALQRPTTWKKDYLPIWDKMASGAPLTPEEARKLAEYNVQREKEFATGVSTYKAEAQNAKHLQDAIAPFLPDLQQNNINPVQWIQNLGNAHKALATGSPEQKLQIFAKLAQDYGVPLAAIAPNTQGQLDPIIPQLMQEIQNLKQGVNTVTSWREQQEQQTIQNELKKFSDAEKYPHFEQVRGTMAQLLESGLAQDLEAAYVKAVRMNDEVWTAEQERQANALAAKQAADKAAAVAKAKANAVSTKTTTPSGVATAAVAKDRRASLVEKFSSMDGGRV